MKEKLIKNYIDKLTTNDIKNFAKENDIILDNQQIKYIYNLIQKNWQTLIFGNPTNIFNDLRTKLPQDTYNKLYSLYQTYKNKYSHYL